MSNVREWLEYTKDHWLIMCAENPTRVGVIDFETASAKPEHLAIYGRQLRGYA